MKKKVDTSQGLNTSAESQTTTAQNQKTKAGQAISSIWTGIKNIFTGKTASPVTATGTTLEVKDNQGNVVASKNTNTNWGGILAGVGLLFTSVFPNAIDTGTTNTQPDPSVQQKQLERTGQNVVIVFVLGGVALIGGLIYAFRKKDD